MVNNNFLVTNIFKQSIYSVSLSIFFKIFAHESKNRLPPKFVDATKS